MRFQRLLLEMSKCLKNSSPRHLSNSIEWFNKSQKIHEIHHQESVRVKK